MLQRFKLQEQPARLQVKLLGVDLDERRAANERRNEPRRSGDPLARDESR